MLDVSFEIKISLEQVYYLKTKIPNIVFPFMCAL